MLFKGSLLCAMKGGQCHQSLPRLLPASFLFRLILLTLKNIRIILIMRAVSVGVVVFGCSPMQIVIPTKRRWLQQGPLEPGEVDCPLAHPRKAHLGHGVLLTRGTRPLVRCLLDSLRPEQVAPHHQSVALHRATFNCPLSTGAGFPLLTYLCGSNRRHTHNCRRVFPLWAETEGMPLLIAVEAEPAEAVAWRVLGRLRGVPRGWGTGQPRHIDIKGGSSAAIGQRLPVGALSSVAAPVPGAMLPTAPRCRCRHLTPAEVVHQRPLRIQHPGAVLCVGSHAVLLDVGELVVAEHIL